MKVSVPIDFEVESDEGEVDREIAEVAAFQASYDYLSFTKISGYSTDSEEVEVHIDGFGKCRVRLVEGDGS